MTKLLKNFIQQIHSWTLNFFVFLGTFRGLVFWFFLKSIFFRFDLNIQLVLTTIFLIFIIFLNRWRLRLQNLIHNMSYSITCGTLIDGEWSLLIFRLTVEIFIKFLNKLSYQALIPIWYSLIPIHQYQEIRHKKGKTKQNPNRDQLQCGL